MRRVRSPLALLLATLLFAVTLAHSQEAATNAAPASPQATADAIAKEVAQIRGLEFKQPVGVEIQSPDKFREYVTARIDEVVPPNLRRHYGKVVQTLGLYRGPPIEDLTTMMTGVMSSQAGAYYDPKKQRFYVLMTRMPELMQGAIYSHELYHALQDQHFSLDRYMLTDRRDPSYSGDRLLARQSVVEGEATYMMTLWTVQKMAKIIPPREVLARAIELQSDMSMDQLRAMIQQQAGLREMVGEDVQKAMESADGIPPFILDTMIGAYLKGMGFVFAVHEQGWPAVEKLYTEYPPQSTEQILHPEKWLAREAAVNFVWPDLGKVSDLRDWELLDDDVLGEFQWRVVFKVHGLTAEAESAAAGWGGDRYAVFKHRKSDATLLMLRTTWDTAADAAEFAEAYRKVLAVKYADSPKPTRVEQKGVDVFIVEGGDEAKIDSLLRVVRNLRRL